MNKYQKFRRENPIFIYKGYEIKEFDGTIELSYDFVIPELAEFHPKWNFTKPKGSTEHKFSEDLTFEKLVFSLGMAEAVSYWKSVCAPEMHVKCGELSDIQIECWKKLYFMGLGEFFYVNGIDADFDSFVKIIPSGKFRSSQSEKRKPLSGCLVPIGGGKDSALTLEILSRNGINCKCYSINSRKSITETVLTAGLSEDSLIISKRIFDRSLINLNNEGYLNGHTPFSAIVAFSAEITAYINRLKYIVLSNESSANESTVAGQNVNHQYSKSFEFENDFHIYEQEFLCTGIYYFSFLRPLSEFHIAKMFTALKKYLPIFRSCNLGSKVSPYIWCADCPKCLFVCLILSPFLSTSEITEIFGKNLLEQPNMLDYFKELTGNSKHKPFECVGSVDEVNLAVSLALRRMENTGEKLPLLFRWYKESGLYIPNTIDERLYVRLNSYDNQNLLPVKFEKILKQEMERLL